MIRFGVIGTGARAHSLVNTIVQDKKKRGDLVALCDLRPQALEEMQRIVKRTLSHDCKTY
jgi:predicted dehydrogenase